jgi:ribosomal protein S18 acetylase RimI-like enzyme
MFVRFSGCGLSFGGGKYLEIDNFIVHPEHRKKGLARS